MLPQHKTIAPANPTLSQRFDRGIQMVAMGATGVFYRALLGLSRNKTRSNETTMHLHIDAIDEEFQNVSFTFAVIALSARVSCASGALTTEKYLAFRENFPLKGDMCSKIRNLFVLACEDTTPITHYCNQITTHFPNAHKLYKDLIEKLVRIALSQGSISKEDDMVLRQINHHLGLQDSAYQEIRTRYKKTTAPHNILGIRHDATAREVKKRYHELMRRYHPDQFEMEELSPELHMLLKAKSTNIINAYHAIKKRKKW